MCPVNQFSIARRAIRGILYMPGHIPNVNIMQTIFLCNLVSRFQCGDGGRGEMSQFIVRKEPRKMEGVSGPKFSLIH